MCKCPNSQYRKVNARDRKVGKKNPKENLGISKDRRRNMETEAQ